MRITPAQVEIWRGRVAETQRTSRTETPDKADVHVFTRAQYHGGVRMNALNPMEPL